MDEIYLSSGGSKGVNPEFCWDLDISNGIQYDQCYDLAATFADWADGFGDTAYGAFPIISYPEPGNYTITMIIRSRYGDNIVGRDVIYRYNFTSTSAIITEHDTIEIDAGKDKSVESGKKTTFSGRAKVYSKFEPEYFVGCRWDFESDGIWDVVQEFDRTEKLQEIVCPGIHTYILNTTTRYDTIFNASFDATVEGELALYPTSNSSAPVTPAPRYNASVNDMAQRTIPAPPNLAPVLICCPDKTGENAAFVGEETEFWVQAHDPDGDMIVSYMWDFDNDGQIDYENPATGNTTYAYKSAGSYVARANVTDERGGEGICYVNVTVKSNQYPIAIINAEAEVDAGEEASFDGSESSDPDGPKEIIGYEWDFDEADGLTSDATEKYASHTYTKGGSYVVTLKVKDRHGAENSVTHDITVNQDYGVLLDVSGQNTVEVKPGTSHTFSLKITNIGTGDDCYDLDKSGSKSTWGELSITEACLGGGESRDFTLRAAVPYSASADDEALIKIEAGSHSSTSAVDIIQIKVRAKQSYGVSVYMVELRADIKQKEMKSVSFRITNLGNGEDSYKLEASGPDGSWAKFTSTTVTIKPGSSKEVTVKFTVPGSAKTGEHTITLIAKSNGDSVKKDSLVFTVNVKEGETTTNIPGFDMAVGIMAIGLATIFIAVRTRRKK